MESSAGHYSLSTVIKTEPVIELDNGNSVEFGTNMTNPCPASVSHAGLDLSDSESQTDRDLMRNAYTSYNCASNDLSNMSNEINRTDMPDGLVDPKSVFPSVALVKNSGASITCSRESCATGMTGCEIDDIVSRQKDSSHSCFYCARSFTTPAGLNGHLRMHGARAPASTHHKLSGSLTGNYTSNIFGQINGDAVSGQASESQEHTCKQCHKVFKRRRYLKRHELKIHIRKQLKHAGQTRLLIRKLSSPDTAKALAPCGTKPDRLNCHHCGRVFVNITVRRRHEVSHCYNSMKCPCPYCPKEYARLEDVKRHVKQVHPSVLDTFLSATAGQTGRNILKINPPTNILTSQELESEDTRTSSSSISPQNCPDGRSKIDVAHPGVSHTDLSPSSNHLSKVASPAICTALGNFVSFAENNNVAEDEKLQHNNIPVTKQDTPLKQLTKSTPITQQQAPKTTQQQAPKTTQQQAPKTTQQQSPKTESRRDSPNLHQSQPPGPRPLKIKTRQKQSCLEAANVVPSTEVSILGSASIPDGQDLLQNLHIPDSSAMDSSVEVIQEVITRVVIQFPDGSMRNEVYRRIL